MEPLKDCESQKKSRIHGVPPRSFHAPLTAASTPGFPISCYNYHQVIQEQIEQHIDIIKKLAQEIH
jgi:hypothetical protein